MRQIGIRCTGVWLYSHENPNLLKEEFGEKVDFSLKQGTKVKINIATEGKKEKKEEKTSAFNSK